MPALEKTATKAQVGELQSYAQTRGFNATTIPGLFWERCHRTPGKVAFRAKRLGIYKDVTWQEYLDQVERFCLGLLELGFEGGERGAIMGDPCPEFFYADLAIQAAGGITYGIYPTSSVSEIKYLLEDGGARFVVAEDQEHLDKLLQVADQLPSVKKIILIDTRCLFVYQDQRIATFKQVQELGEKKRQQSPVMFQELVSRVKPEDIATLMYTSGTTGPAKGAMISNYNLLWGWFGWIELIGDLGKEEQRSVCYLPAAHGTARLIDEYLPMLAGHVTHFSEQPETTQETIFEVSPTIFLGAPRTYEKYASEVLIGIETSSLIKKVAYKAAMKAGRSYRAREWDGKAPWWLTVLYRLAYWAVFRSILEKMGFLRAKVAIVSAAPVPPRIVALWQIWGLNLRELYGQTESGTIAAQWEDFPRPGNAGTRFSRVEIKVSEAGEILAKSPSTFVGYWRKDKDTQEAMKDGWVRTGDAAEITKNGQIKICDRIKDIAKTAGGKGITPSEIEKALKSSPYISEAVVYADGRKYPSALIEIDFDAVSEWARNKGIVYTSFTSLANHPKTAQLIEAEVAKANEQLARVEQVKKFRIIPKELDPEEEGDPVTPTRKVQRRKMYEKFKDLVESMYSAEEQARLKAELGELWDTL